ncbi:hypothetical protein F5878DRAFT_646023 [Lentinula raphanica]|uniref:CxC2-like cysteine cluster KDZ transposase-associated domain-containing protein n=1 Tax=Lentinula raphanica TaxID=153919 RepID=A0AA38U6M6_9AGAR|nr:hypothetical protein F5878DRAFT_646023 [Lentinula raphanica]
MGLRIQLGHPDGSICPYPAPGPADFVVINTNKIHRVTLDFCHCPLSDRLHFPSPRAVPHVEKLTDNIGGKRFSPLQPGVSGPKFKSRYSAFLRMARQWRHLKELKCGGRGNDGVRMVKDTRVGELGVQCIACPRPGVNLPEDWENSPEEQQFLYVVFIAIDACFCLKNRQISLWTVDPPLGDGWSYFVESEAYREFCKQMQDQNEMCTCTGLSALDHANTKYSSGYRATGMGMCTCARHEVVMGNSVGDLQCGEQYSNMDYIFTSTLRHFSDLLHLLISYDIACQWSKKLLERLKALPPLVRLRGILNILAFVIPKLHILGHTIKCQQSFNLSYTRGAGQSDGEGIERIWSGSGLLGTSTREMGPGSRQNTCEDYWHHWNWRKVIGLHL